MPHPLKADEDPNRHWRVFRSNWDPNRILMPENIILAWFLRIVSTREPFPTPCV